MGTRPRNWSGWGVKPKFIIISIILIVIIIVIIIIIINNFFKIILLLSKKNHKFNFKGLKIIRTWVRQI